MDHFLTEVKQKLKLVNELADEENVNSEAREMIRLIKIGCEFLVKGLDEVCVAMETLAYEMYDNHLISSELCGVLLRFIECSREAGFVETSSDHFEPRWLAEQQGFIKKEFDAFDGCEYER